MRKLILIVSMIFLAAGPEILSGDSNSNPVEQQQHQNPNRRKILTQGCLIGGAIVILAGVGFGTGWAIDRSNSSVNYEIDIDIDYDTDNDIPEIEEPYPIIIYYPYPTPSPSLN